MLPAVYIGCYIIYNGSSLFENDLLFLDFVEIIYHSSLGTFIKYGDSGGRRLKKKGVRGGVGGEKSAKFERILS